MTFHVDPSQNGQGEPLVVIGLGSFLKQWVEEWRSSRPPNRKVLHHEQGWSDNTPNFMSAYYYLEEQTGIHHDRLRAIASGKIARVSLSQADLIVSALERPDLLRSRGISVIPNPNYTQEQWISRMRERGCI